jgi:hypothetical protein
MAEEVRLWQIREGDKLQPCPRSRLDLEQRLEKWLTQDIGILAPNLLVIGRQVETDYGGYIDLLCLDDAGDLVVIELKRHRTPREIAAQVLDYAAWVKDLGRERITAIAQGFLGANVTLEQAFENRFGSPLPDSLNSEQRMLIVGSETDLASERIIRYLSETFGVGINAATFSYFKTPERHEYVARVFLIAPAEADEHQGARGGSKRKANLTSEQLEESANNAGVGDLYRSLLARLELVFTSHTTRTAIAFTGEFSGSTKVLFSFIPGQSDRQHGLRFQLYSNRLVALLGITMDRLRQALPSGTEPWSYDRGPDWEGFTGYLLTQADADKLLDVLL